MSPRHDAEQRRLHVALALLLVALCVLPIAIAVGHLNGLSLVGVILASSAITCAVRAT